MSDFEKRRDPLAETGRALRRGGLEPDSAGETIPAARPCPACGGLKSSPYPASGGRRHEGCATVRCDGCSLVFIDPVPREAIAEESYGPGYYEPWQKPREAHLRLRLWKRRLALVEERQTRGSLLDVGCGDGLFLSVARDIGWSVEGIEFSPDGARRSSKRLGRPVAVGDLTASTGLRGPFDVVTLWHVLEHLVAPASMLAAARQRLRPGGLLVVAVPNLDNLPMRAAYRIVRNRKLPLYEEGAREPHLSHFSPATLRSFLRRQGFDRTEMRADLCALTPGKRALDGLAWLLSVCTGRLLTDAMVAFARRPR